MRHSLPAAVTNCSLSEFTQPPTCVLTTPGCSAMVLSHLSVETAMRRKPRVVCCWEA